MQIISTIDNLFLTMLVISQGLFHTKQPEFWNDLCEIFRPGFHGTNINIYLTAPWFLMTIMMESWIQK